MPPPAEGFAARLVLGPALRTQPDRRLVGLVREGYEVAFEEIVRRYGKPLTRYAGAIVGSRAEDVTQDAFSKALLALRRNGAEIELRPWLFRIVRNTALNELRDRPPSAELLAEEIAGGGSPTEVLARREELADLMRRLQSLPEPQRAAIVMRELEGLSHEEIAAALGLSGGAARQAIYRARRALRDSAGMLIPLPLLQMLLGGGGSGAAETAGAAGLSAAGVGSAGVALKATAATVLVAGAVGAGVAIKENRPSGNAKAAPARVSQDDASSTTSSAATAPTVPTQDTSFSHGEDRTGEGGQRGHGGSDEPEAGDDHGGGAERVDDHRGHEGGGPEAIDDRGGRGDSGRHGGGSGHGDSSDHSGSSGHGGGPGSSGSGHGGSGHDEPGSGHGGSGSGHGGSGDSSAEGGSGSSGSGHDDDPAGAHDGSAPAPSGEAVEDDGSGESGGESGSGEGSGSSSGSGGGEDGAPSPTDLP